MAFIVDNPSETDTEVNTDAANPDTPAWGTTSYYANLPTHLLIRGDSVSTNATEDDRPGPGRALDKLFQLAGRRLERFLNTVAMRFGAGPVAAEERLIIALRGLGTNWSPDVVLLASNSTNSIHRKRKKLLDKLANEGCKRILRYVRSDVPSTQIRALFSIMTLAAGSQHARTYFRNHGAEETILKALYIPKVTRDWGSTPEYGELLLSTSRRALISLEENELSTVGKEALWPMEQLCFDCADSLLGKQKTMMWKERCNMILKYLRHESLSFLALRYLNNCYTATALVMHIRKTDASENMFEAIARSLTRLAKNFPKSEVQESLRFEQVELVNAIELTMLFGSMANFPINSQPHRTLLCLHAAYSDILHLLDRYSYFTSASLQEFRSRVLLCQWGQSETKFYLGNPCRSTISIVNYSRVDNCRHTREKRRSGKSIWTFCECSTFSFGVHLVEDSPWDDDSNTDDFVAIHMIHTKTDTPCLSTTIRRFYHCEEM